jgi:hypothetical protein
MNPKAPWYAALIIAVLEVVSARHPEYKGAVQEVVNILTIVWFGHVSHTLETIKRNGNGGAH